MTMRRHTPLYANRSMERDPMGEWVSFDDANAALAEVELLSTSRSEQALKLIRENERLDVELRQSKLDASRDLARYQHLVKAARERLLIHGHTANCPSRYSSVS